MARCLTERVVFSGRAEQSQGNTTDFSVSFLTLQEAVTRSCECEVSAAAWASEPCVE